MAFTMRVMGINVNQCGRISGAGTGVSLGRGDGGERPMTYVVQEVWVCDEVEKVERNGTLCERSLAGNGWV